MVLGAVLLMMGLVAANWVFSPFQDRRSAAYRKWEADRARASEHQARIYAAFLAESFRYRALELVHVGPGRNYFSWWGHLLLRLKGSGSAPEEDLALSLLADFNDFPVNRWKAAFGGYRVYPKLDRYRAYEAEYLHGENRFMRPLPLRTTEEQRTKLLERLRTWVRAPETPGTYKFATENCVGMMDRLLVEGGVLKSSLGRYPIWPWNLRRLLAEAGALAEAGSREDLA